MSQASPLTAATDSALSELRAAAATQYARLGPAVQELRAGSLAGSAHVWLNAAGACPVPAPVVRELGRVMAEPHVSLGRGADAHTLAAEALHASVSGAFAEHFAGGRGTLLFGFSATHLLLALGRTVIARDAAPVIAHGHPDHRASYALSSLPGWHGRLRIPYTDAGFYERHGARTLPAGSTVLWSALHPVYGTLQYDGLSALPGHVRVISDVSQALKVAPAQQLAPFFERASAAVFNLGKLFSPLSLGVLWVRERALAEQLLQDNPELSASLAGLPVHALASALAFVRQRVDAPWLEYLSTLTRYAVLSLQSLPHVTLLGCSSWLPNTQRLSIVSFMLDGLSAREVGSYLDAQGLAVRADGVCLGDAREPGTQEWVRISLLPHVTTEDLDRLASALRACA